MANVMQKEDAHRLVDQLPPDATWDDLMREIYVRETIEKGMADRRAGRTRDVKEVRAKYGLAE
jgi:predicted transcriptional regulator